MKHYERVLETIRALLEVVPDDMCALPYLDSTWYGTTVTVRVFPDKSSNRQESGVVSVRTFVDSDDVILNERFGETMPWSEAVSKARKEIYDACT